MFVQSQDAISDAEFERFRKLIHEHTGIALSEHKRALVCSRLGKRLRHHRLTSFSDYYRLVTDNDPDGHELRELINAITTNKTEFLREAHHFSFLADSVLPYFRQALNGGLRQRLRIWSAGTSTGEEAYSIAMTVLDAIPNAGLMDVRILATDIDTRVLDRAEQGIYSAEHAARLPEPWLQRYFLRGRGDHEGQIRVKPAVRELVRFRHLNLQQDPWPMTGPFDVIFCRNVVIYFDKPTQQRLFRRFARMLRADGFLMLGHSESLHGIDCGFYPVGHSIYRCHSAAAAPSRGA
jgi:chemotaxis protein methyltransferase CheR